MFLSSAFSLIMDLFDLEGFVHSLTLDKFDKCQKDDLCLIADYFSISVTKSLVKRELKAIVLDGLVTRHHLT